jgi:PTH2 family peptidyl-tRNA hydrolase
VNESKIKQVILIRKDLKMRRGKEIAQGSHAAMDFLVSRLRLQRGNASRAVLLNEHEIRWIDEGMAKVCLRVDSQESLEQCHQQAREIGLESHIIRDSGKTEFGGVPTLTACAIGPGPAQLIDQVTGELVLY